MARPGENTRVVVTCRILPELLKILDKLAETERRSRSEMIELAVAEKLERDTSKKRPGNK